MNIQLLEGDLDIQDEVSDATKLEYRFLVMSIEKCRRHECHVSFVTRRLNANVKDEMSLATPLSTPGALVSKNVTSRHSR